MSDQDIQWTRSAELELVPHLGQPRPKITEMDDNMQGGVLRMELRATTAGYILAWAKKDYATILHVADKLPEATLQKDEKLLTLYDMALTRSEEN